jgi:uncharacterized membrane protein YbaN (DUF454 family)
MTPNPPPPDGRHRRLVRTFTEHTRRLLWIALGVMSLVTGIIGIVVPLLPTTPFVLLAAFCFARGSQRWEAWLLSHPHFGPMVHDWRERRAVPLRAKQLASVMMVVGCAISALTLPMHLIWIPPACCGLVAWWLWRLPNR